MVKNPLHFLREFSDISATHAKVLVAAGAHVGYCRRASRRTGCRGRRTTHPTPPSQSGPGSHSCTLPAGSTSGAVNRRRLHALPLFVANDQNCANRRFNRSAGFTTFLGQSGSSVSRCHLGHRIEAIRIRVEGRFKSNAMRLGQAAPVFALRSSRARFRCGTSGDVVPRQGGTGWTAGSRCRGDPADIAAGAALDPGTACRI